MWAYFECKKRDFEKKSLCCYSFVIVSLLYKKVKKMWKQFYYAVLKKCKFVEIEIKQNVSFENDWCDVEKYLILQ